jgi:hypothetical protein
MKHKDADKKSFEGEKVALERKISKIKNDINAN